eukprot:SAG31_NODE_2091_length_6465_cov_2.429626_2_plen_91_part_00
MLTQIIPVTIFGILDEVAALQSRRLQELPTKVEVDDLKSYAQLEQRYELAKSTHRISVFTDGILAMDGAQLVMVLPCTLSFGNHASRTFA